MTDIQSCGIVNLTSNVQQHVSNETNELCPFACDVCAEKFADSDDCSSSSSYEYHSYLLEMREMEEAIELWQMLFETRLTFHVYAESKDATGYVNKIKKHKSLIAAKLRKQNRSTSDKRWKTSSSKKRTTASYLAEDMD